MPAGRLVHRARARSRSSSASRSRSCPGSVRVRTWYSGISAGTELTAYRGSNPYLTSTWDPDAPAVRRRARRPSPTRSRAGATPRSARSSRSPTTSTALGGRGRRLRHLGPPQRGGGAGRGRARPRAGRRTRPGRGHASRASAPIALNAVLAADVAPRRPGRRLRPGRDRAARHPAGRRSAAPRSSPSTPSRAGSSAARALGAARGRRAPTSPAAPAPPSARWSRRRGRRGDRAQRQRPGPARGDPLRRGRRDRGRLRLLPGRAPSTCGSARSSTTTGSASWPARSPAPRSALGPRWDQPRLVSDVHGPGAPPAGSTSLRWSPTWSTPPTWPRSSSASTRGDPDDPAGRAPLPTRPRTGEPRRDRRRRPARPTPPRVPGRPLGRRDPRLRHHRAVRAPARLRSSTAWASTGVWSRDAGDHRGVRERFPFVGRVYDSAEELLADPEVRYRRPRHRARGPARLDRGGDRRRQARAGPEAADAVGRRPGPRCPPLLARADAAGRPGRGQPQRPLGPAVAAGHPAAAAGRRRRGRRRDPPARQAAAAAGRARRSTTCRTCCSPTTSCTGSTSPAAGSSRRPTAGRGDVGPGDRLPGARPAGRRAQPVVGHARPDRRSAGPRRRCGSSATRVASEPGCPFWVHGTAGTLRGSVLLDSDRLALDDGDRRRTTCRWPAPGSSTASPATMGELMCAVAEDREPENSAADAAGSVRAGARRRASPPSAGGVPGRRPRTPT